MPTAEQAYTRVIESVTSSSTPAKGSADSALGRVIIEFSEPTVVTPSLYPRDYWEYEALKLALNSVDEKGAARYKSKANVPGEYVAQLQGDLITLGYLAAGTADGWYGPAVARAVTRFRRHAARPWRMPRGQHAQADAGKSELFAGNASSECDHATADEIQKWIKKEWKIPVGRFPIRALATGGGRLRGDVADLFEKAFNEIAALGGTLEGPYGTTVRSIEDQGGEGTSRYSYHYAGRAIDLNQTLGDPGAQRYFYVKEDNASDSARPWWNVYCKTADQTGKQGTEMTEGQVMYWQYEKNATTGGQEKKLPKGYYLDLTNELAKRGFERICAHADWKTVQKSQEWWHFQYANEKEATFLDECELAGITEDQLRKAGWKEYADLDHAAG